MAHFISESFDMKEFVATSETHPYSDAHREAEPSRDKPTHAAPLGVFASFIPRGQASGG